VLKALPPVPMAGTLTLETKSNHELKSHSRVSPKNDGMTADKKSNQMAGETSTESSYAPRDHILMQLQLNPDLWDLFWQEFKMDGPKFDSSVKKVN
jgi:hypothetical protein